MNAESRHEEKQLASLKEDLEAISSFVRKHLSKHREEARNRANAKRRSANLQRNDNVYLYQYGQRKSGSFNLDDKWEAGWIVQEFPTGSLVTIRHSDGRVKHIHIEFLKPANRKWPEEIDATDSSAEIANEFSTTSVIEKENNELSEDYEIESLQDAATQQLTSGDLIREAKSADQIEVYVKAKRKIIDLFPDASDEDISALLNTWQWYKAHHHPNNYFRMQLAPAERANEDLSNFYSFVTGEEATVVTIEEAEGDHVKALMSDLSSKWFKLERTLTPNEEQAWAVRDFLSRHVRDQVSPKEVASIRSFFVCREAGELRDFLEEREWSLPGGKIKKDLLVRLCVNSATQSGVSWKKRKIQAKKTPLRSPHGIKCNRTTRHSPSDSYPSSSDYQEPHLSLSFIPPSFVMPQQSLGYWVHCPSVSLHPQNGKLLHVPIAKPECIHSSHEVKWRWFWMEASRVILIGGVVHIEDPFWKIWFPAPQCSTVTLNY